VRVAGLSVSQVNRLLKINLDAVPVSGTAGGKTRNPSSELKVVEYTAAGRPKAVRLGDKNFPATVARDLLGLRSTDFSMKLKNDEVIVRTSGYGHGVGMCQYGAKGFAEHDYTYGQILKHYYTGVEIARLPER
jgi:stage II sporulation protein D